MQQRAHDFLKHAGKMPHRWRFIRPEHNALPSAPRGAGGKNSDKTGKIIPDDHFENDPGPPRDLLSSMTEKELKEFDAQTASREARTQERCRVRGHVRNKTTGAAQLRHNGNSSDGGPFFEYASSMEQCLELDGGS